jgi:hypothetical protein
VSRDRIIIGDFEFVAAPIPQGRGRRSTWTVGPDALAAMDELGVDSVRCATEMGPGIAASWNKKAQAAGLPVKFYSRKAGDGYDIYAARINGSEVDA